MDQTFTNLPQFALLAISYLVIALASALGAPYLYRAIRSGQWFGWSAGIIALVLFVICGAMALAVGAQAAVYIAGALGILAAFLAGHEVADKRHCEAVERAARQRAEQAAQHAAEPPANILERERRQRRVSPLLLKSQAAVELEECALATAQIAAAQQKIAQAAAAISARTSDLQIAKHANEAMSAATAAYDVAMQIRHTLERIPVVPAGQ